MTLVKLHLSDIATQMVGSDDFGLRWERLLFPADGLQAFHLGPVMFGNSAVLTEGRGLPAFPTPVDETTPLTGGDPAATQGAGDPTAGSPIADEANPFGGESQLFWHPPYFMLESLQNSDPNVANAHDQGSFPHSLAAGDLDPILAAMGAGIDHAPTGDLGAAFLAPGANEPPHGLDPGLAITPLPPLPPPDVI